MGLQGSKPGATELLIVGVTHLSDSVPDTALRRGTNLLRAWQPDVIAIEHLPGHLVVEYEIRGGAFADFPVGGAPLAREGAATVVGTRPWNVWQAKAAARGHRNSITDRIIGWLLAREPCNALLLPWHQAAIPDAAADFLARLEASPSERVRIGVRLARDLGHHQLIHFDDHAGVDLLNELPREWETIVDTFQASMDVRWPKPTPPAGSDRDTWLEWTWATTPEFRDWIEELESAAMSDEPDTTGVLRARLAQWRTRNLAMASRLREASALIPGGRLLAIVGSSHERPLRAALAIDQHDLTLTDINHLNAAAPDPGDRTRTTSRRPD